MANIDGAENKFGLHIVGAENKYEMQGVSERICEGLDDHVITPLAKFFRIKIGPV